MGNFSYLFEALDQAARDGVYSEEFRDHVLPSGRYPFSISAINDLDVRHYMESLRSPDELKPYWEWLKNLKVSGHG